MAMSSEAKAYAKITPTTRLKNAVTQLAKAKVALQHLQSFNGENLSNEQVYVAVEAVINASDDAIVKLEDLKKRVKGYLKSV